MKTLNISISENQIKQFGITEQEYSFSEFIKLAQKISLKQALNKSISLAKKNDLSKMTMEEITKEVKAVRNAKNNY